MCVGVGGVGCGCGCGCGRVREGGVCRSTSCLALARYEKAALSGSARQPHHQSVTICFATVIAVGVFTSYTL